MLLTIDGMTYNVPCEVRRTAEISASEISGLMLDGSYFNDVLGTYLTYELSFTYPLYDQDRYAAVIEKLTEPVDGHTFVLPYNNGVVTVTARVETVSDEFVHLDSGREFWRETRFEIIANHPTRAMSLGEALTRGRTVLPEIAEPHDGDTYTYVNGQWVTTIGYDDADTIYF